MPGDEAEDRLKDGMIKAGERAVGEAAYDAPAGDL